MGKSLVLKVLDKQNNLSEFSLLAFTFIVFILSFHANAQVIIKEKVEINPSSIVTPDDPVNSYYCNHIDYPYYYQNTYGEMQCLRSFCDTSVVWYGEDFHNFCFLPTVTKSINVVEGSEYIQIYLGYVPPTSETGSCFDCTEYFVTSDNLFLQPDGECTYIKFNETKPTDTAFVKIIVTDYSDEVYTFNVFVVNPVFTLFDYTYDHNLKRNTEITLDVCASPQFGYSLNLPDTTKYNVEIITGSDFGNLVNNTTSDSGQVLNDLPHNYGCLDQIILRTNDQIQADDEIKILISTSDPSIEPIEITFTNLLVVNIVPETIAPGDTAQIIPKLKNPDGSLSDFPIEQTFEIGMLDGCALGMIKTATDSGVYVDAALQPFYFIADTGAVEGTVKLRVGVIEGMSSSSLLNNNLKSRKSENQIKKSSASDNRREAQSFIDGGVIGEYCFLGDLYSVVTGDANVGVEDNWCDDLDECDEIEFPDIDIDVYENNWEGLDACGTDLLAGTDFLKSENSRYREDFDIELCKEEGSDIVQFTFDDDLVINCVSDMCEANISAGNDILIDDVYSFPQNTPCKDKLFWIDLHKRYPYPTKIGTPTGTYESVYVIEDIWMRHEKVHRDHFLEVAEKFKSKYLTKIKDTQKKCSNFTGEENANPFLKKKAEEIIKDFYDEVKKEDDRISKGGDDGGDVIKFEKDKIHKKVIDDYIQPLINRWKLNNCVD